ncbi:hypothetical protein [Acinetobacter modestus]|uniref:hypothetical protein n=1 Tax=Acinetobacter modestus TaxID=1776740 RepID=UPI001F4B57F2|nr:hypothetical protein [Acinetobacter modestus]MCH7331830.1 hypothetical protein [Acinetobacter modestus]
MATDLKVQFFSHLNGLALGNNWGDMVRLLDNCLVNGLALSSVTAASIDANGDINLTFFAAHNAVLFQIVELTGFSPSNINAKYRIKGLPTSTQMILKAELTGQSITANGSAKLAALGYDIIYRDANDVKRVYRAKNPHAEHPFIRVDESISDGVNSYNSAYAKSALVGLIENMTHIDDYEDLSKLQLPLDTNDFKKNWKITGTGATVVRGWSKWHWATDRGYEILESSIPQNGNRHFTLVGDSDAFYLLFNSSTAGSKRLNGCGLFKNSLANNLIPNWFLMSCVANNNASQYISTASTGFMPFFKSDVTARFFTTRYDVLNRLSNSIEAIPLLPNFSSGGTNIFSQTNVPALEIPFYDSNAYLRGSLHHVFYAGKNISNFTETKPILADNSMYVADSAYMDSGDSFVGGLYFYLGELE